MSTQAVYYRDPDGVEPVAEFLDREFPLEPRKKNPSAREIEAAAKKRMTVDLQIDRLNGLANDDPPLPFPHTSQIDGPLRELRCHYGRAHYRILYRRSGNLFVLTRVRPRLAEQNPDRVVAATLGVGVDVGCSVDVVAVRDVAAIGQAELRQGRAEEASNRYRQPEPGGPRPKARSCPHALPCREVSDGARGPYEHPRIH